MYIVGVDKKNTSSLDRSVKVPFSWIIGLQYYQISFKYIFFWGGGGGGYFSIYKVMEGNTYLSL